MRQSGNKNEKKRHWIGKVRYKRVKKKKIGRHTPQIKFIGKDTDCHSFHSFWGGRRLSWLQNSDRACICNAIRIVQNHAQFYLSGIALDLSLIRVGEYGLRTTLQKQSNENTLNPGTGQIERNKGRRAKKKKATAGVLFRGKSLTVGYN